MMGYMHYLLSIRCSTRPPPPPPPAWPTCKDARVHPSLTFDSLLYLLLLSLLLLFLLHQVWPVSNFFRSALIVSQVCSIDSSHRVHSDLARTLGYIHYWLPIRCSTPPSPLATRAGLTPFNILQINSDWLTSRRHRFGLSSTSRWCNDAGVYAIFTR